MHIEMRDKMKYYAVIDTNVLVSAMLKWDSVPGCVLEHAFVGDIIPLLNEQVLAEYLEVLSRPKFNFNMEKVKIVIDGLIKRVFLLIRISWILSYQIQRMRYFMK